MDEIESFVKRCIDCIGFWGWFGLSAFYSVLFLRLRFEFCISRLRMMTTHNTHLNIHKLVIYVARWGFGCLTLYIDILFFGCT
jgi:hypothetical protein